MSTPIDHRSDTESRSAGELTKQLTREVSELVRKEVELAKLETAGKARAMALGAGFFGAAAALGLVVLGALTAAAVMALNLRLTGWLSALIVATVVAVLTVILALAGKRALNRAVPPVPRESIEQMKEDVAWIKTRAKSATR